MFYWLVRSLSFFPLSLSSPLLSLSSLCLFSRSSVCACCPCLPWISCFMSRVCVMCGRQADALLLRLFFFFGVLNQTFFGCRYCWGIHLEIPFLLPSWLTCPSVTILRGVCRPSSKLYVSMQTDLEVFPGSSFQSWTFFCLGHSLKP